MWGADNKQEFTEEYEPIDESTVRVSSLPIDIYDEPDSTTTVVSTSDSKAEANRNGSRNADANDHSVLNDHSEGLTGLRREWFDELATIGGASPMLHFSDDKAHRIDLSTTHPGGLPQFIGGNTVLLSQLIRDDRSLHEAKIAAANVTDKATEMRAVRGLETVHLGIGTASWHFEGIDYLAPVLLRPLAIRRHGDDFQLKLKGTPFFNEALARSLRQQFGVSLNTNEYVALSQESGVFKPQPVIDRLRHAAVGISDFNVQPRLVATTFADISYDLPNDIKNAQSVILDALTGDEAARAKLKSGQNKVASYPENQRSPETDNNLYSSDRQQEEVQGQIAAGNSIAVHTLPGTGGTQTVVNAIGSLVRSGRRVLVVSPRRATLDGISHRVSRAGLAGLTVSPRLLRRNLVEAIGRNEKVAPGNDREVDAALVRLRSVLVDYQDALLKPDSKLGVSPIEALHALSRLTQEEYPPTTLVRLSPDSLQALAMDRSSVLEALTEAARLGQFEYGPEDSPWYNVAFKSSAEADKAYNLAVELAQTKLPRLTSMANEVVSQTPMRPYTSLAELGVYLRLLSGIRETLDRFLPSVFDRSLTEVIAAHAPRGSEDIPSSKRRSLKKLAKEFVRPGGPLVNDMYSRLVQIQQQRVLWQRYSAVVGARPEIPNGISDLVVAYQKTYQDLDTLDITLDPEQSGKRLRNIPLADLAALMNDLARDSEVLHNIHERTALVDQLNAANLGELLDDLSARHVPTQQVGNELEQAWWQSALEYMLQNKTELLGANTSVVERLEADFRLVDDAHSRANGPALARDLAKNWRVAIGDHPEEATYLRDSLRSGTCDIEFLVSHTPNLLQALVPVWMVSPYEVAELPRAIKFDTVLLVDSSATSVAEQLGAITRADQVVAFGDPVVQKPQAFEVGVGVSDHAADHDHASAFEELSNILPSFKLTQSYRAGGTDLIDIVNSRFYDGEIKSFPWAGSFLGDSSLRTELVSGGQGLPDRHSGTVESTEAEVEKVVQLVLQHATERPEESLMVITASAKHASRVHAAVMQAFTRFQVLKDFILRDRAEPFAVLTLEEATAQSRDRVIFSIGYGRTPHGRVLSHFGPLSSPGSERLVAVAMTRARKAMVIVSCFKAEDLESSRIKHGVVELKEVLALESSTKRKNNLPSEVDPMVQELSVQLKNLGLRVELDYQGVIPLVASYGGKAVAIDIDSDAHGQSLRETLRLRPIMLRRLGWQYQRVHSFDLFADSHEVAVRIAKTLGHEKATGQESNDSSETAII